MVDLSTRDWSTGPFVKCSRSPSFEFLTEKPAQCCQTYIRIWTKESVDVRVTKHEWHGSVTMQGGKYMRLHIWNVIYERRSMSNCKLILSQCVVGHISLSIILR